MNKIQKIHHSVSELGNLQVRLITEYQDDNGNVIDKKYSDPYTPAPFVERRVEDVEVTDDKRSEPVEEIDGLNMTGWDDKSKDIVTALKPKTVKDAFEAEKKAKVGTGLEEVVTYDRVIEEDGKIAVRRITRIFDDGKEVSKKYHRSWIMPGDDPENNDVISKAVAKKLHTKAVKDAFKVKQLEIV